MDIGAAQIVLDFYGNTDLKVKKRQIEELCNAIKKKYNVSILEADAFDDFERCVIGFAAVIPATWKKQRSEDFIQAICKDIDETAFARVVSTEWDLIGFA